MFFATLDATFSMTPTAPQHGRFAMLEEFVLFGYCWKRGKIPKRLIIDFLLMTCNCTNLRSCILPLLTFHGFSLASASAFISFARTLQTWWFPPCPPLFCLCFIRNMSKDEFIYQYFNYCLSEVNQKEHLWVFFMYILSCCQAVPLIRKHCFFCYIYFLFDVYLCLKEDKCWFYS